MAQPESPFGYSGPAPKRGSSFKVVLSLAIVLAVAVGGRVAWTMLDKGTLFPERARAIETLEKLNKRTPPPASEKAAYDAIGRRIVAPKKPYGPSKRIDAGAVTPRALAETSNGAVTKADVDAWGIRRAWVTGWSTPNERRAVTTWLYEFDDSKNMSERARDQLDGWSASISGGTSPVGMPAGIVGEVTSSKITGGVYALVAVCHGASRMAIVMVMVPDKPGSEELELLRELATKQRSALL